MTTMALVEHAGREDGVGQHCLSLVNISIYLDKCMPAGYQQTAGMLYLSNIRTQEGNKARTELTRQQIISNHGGLALSSKPDRGGYLSLKWRCHIKLIWNPRR